MGMFDWYEPDGVFECPACGDRLTDWQGSGGPNGLFVWRQGRRSPIEQRVDPECKLAPAELASHRLPADFQIRAYCEQCPFPTVAECTTTEGVWSSTVLVTAETAVQRPHERRSDFKARLRLLRPAPSPSHD